MSKSAPNWAKYLIFATFALCMFNFGMEVDTLLRHLGGASIPNLLAPGFASVVFGWLVVRYLRDSALVAKPMKETKAR